MRLIDSATCMRLECVAGSANKFYEIVVDGEKLVTRWGRIGSTGQSKVTPFASSTAANDELERVVAAKQRSGYTPVSDRPVAGVTTRQFNLEVTRKTAAQLQTALAADCAIANYATEGDGIPSFVIADFAEGAALDGASVVEALAPAIERFAGGAYAGKDEEWTVAVRPQAECAKLETAMATPQEDLNPECAHAFGRILKTLHTELAGLTIMRYGPVEEGTEGPSVASGFEMIVGRSVDQKLCGIFVETALT